MPGGPGGRLACSACTRPMRFLVGAERSVRGQAAPRCRALAYANTSTRSCDLPAAPHLPALLDAPLAWMTAWTLCPSGLQEHRKGAATAASAGPGAVACTWHRPERAAPSDAAPHRCSGSSAAPVAGPRTQQTTPSPPQCSACSPARHHATAGQVRRARVWPITSVIHCSPAHHHSGTGTQRARHAHTPLHKHTRARTRCSRRCALEAVRMAFSASAVPCGATATAQPHE